MVNVVRNLVAVLVGIGAWPRVGDDKSRFSLLVLLTLQRSNCFRSRL